MKISRCITVLQQILAQEGDLEIFHLPDHADVVNIPAELDSFEEQDLEIFCNTTPHFLAV